MERTDTCWSASHLRLDTIRAPWQLMSMVGASSAEGLSSLERFTNNFTAIRTSFRLKRAEDANSSPLGREDQHPNPSIRAFQSNSTKGRIKSSVATPSSLWSASCAFMSRNSRSEEGRPLGEERPGLI